MSDGNHDRHDRVLFLSDGALFSKYAAYDLLPGKSAADAAGNCILTRGMV